MISIFTNPSSRAIGEHSNQYANVWYVLDVKYV